MQVTYEQQAKQVSVEQKWLKTAESLTIVASVAGLVATAVSRQVVFSSTPLTLALILNFINRRQNERETQTKVETDLSQLKQDFYDLDRFVAKDIDALRQQLLSRPAAPEQMDISYLKSAVAAVQQEMESRLAPIEALDLLPIQENLAQVRDELGHLEIRVQTLTNQAVPDLITFQSQLDQLHEKFDQEPLIGNSELVDQRFEELRAAIAELEQELQLTTENTLADSEGVTALSAEVQQLHQRQGTLEQQIITAVRSEIQTHLTQISDLGLSSIHRSMAELTSEVMRLQLGLQNLSTHSVVDLTPIQDEIAQLHQRLEQLAKPFDPAPLEQRIDELKAVIVRLEQEAENSPLKQDLALFFSAMRSLARPTDPVTPNG